MDLESQNILLSTGIILRLVIRVELAENGAFINNDQVLLYFLLGIIQELILFV